MLSKVVDALPIPPDMANCYLVVSTVDIPTKYVDGGGHADSPEAISSSGQWSRETPGETLQDLRGIKKQE